jgi:putative transposase
MVTPTVKREAVAHLKGVHEMSERRACKVIGCDRMMVRYRSQRPDDPRLREQLIALAGNAGGSAIGACLSSCARKASS